MDKEKAKVIIEGVIIENVITSLYEICAGCDGVINENDIDEDTKNLARNVKKDCIKIISPLSKYYAENVAN